MSVLRSLSRFVGTTVFTVVETATLAIWLALVDDAPVLSTIAAVGAAVLVAGLVVEAVANTVVVNGVGGLRLAPIAAFSVTEAGIWIAWLATADALGDLTGITIAGADLTGITIAGVVIFALMLPQHAIEDNALRGTPLTSDLLNAGTVGFTLVEAAGATGWLALVRHGPTLLDGVTLTALPTIPETTPTAALGLALLAAFLLVEHLMGLQFALRNRNQMPGI